jgi:hypothetical protein
MNDWNLEADALAAAPDILVLRRRTGKCVDDGKVGESERLSDRSAS